MEPDKLLKQVKSVLYRMFEDRLRDVVLQSYDPQAVEGPQSDVDFMVVLEGEPQEPQDSWACIDAVEVLSREMGRTIHVEPIDVKAYQAVHKQFQNAGKR